MEARETIFEGKLSCIFHFSAMLKGRVCSNTSLLLCNFPLSSIFSNSLSICTTPTKHPKRKRQDKEQEQGTAYYCQNFNNSFSYFGISFLQMFSNVNLGYILPFWMIRVVDLFKILDLPPLLSAFNVFVFWPFTLFFFSNRCLCMHIRAIIIRFRSLWIRFWSLCDKDIAFFWVSCFNDINVLNVQMIQNLRLQ